jgi:hypothetical protein
MLMATQFIKKFPLPFVAPSGLFCAILTRTCCWLF